MMKTFLLSIALCFISVDDNCTRLEEVRQLFQTANTIDKLDEIIKICTQTKCTETTPYLAVATMRKAAFTISPLKKLSHFNSGKKLLENFIIKHPKNVEAKYLRWVTQKNAPFFLGYNNHLKDDYNFVIQHLHQSNINKAYQKIILANIKFINNE